MTSTCEDHEIGFLCLDDSFEEGSGVEIRASSELIWKHVQARCCFSVGVVHVCYLQDLELTVLPKTERKSRVLFGICRSRED